MGIFPHLPKKITAWKVSSFFWSVFSCIREEHRDVRSKSLYSVRIKKNEDQKNSVFWHFSRSESDLFENLFTKENFAVSERKHGMRIRFQYWLKWANGMVWYGMVYLYFLNQEFTFGFHEKIKQKCNINFHKLFN